MTALKLAHSLSLPVEVVGESTAILAKKGAGKSNTAKVIVEETLDHGGVQVIVLDPIGHWWSLRAGADGKPKGGYPVAVFGGMHGDLPLEQTAGRLLARTAVESGQSMVLDVSGLDSDGAMQRFVYEFLEELYKLKQATPTPTYLVLEEADEFAPQDPRGANVPRMIGAANRISKRGRGRGIGMLYVTQRSAALNKNVLDQSDTLIVMRTIGPRDRKAIEGWVQHAQAEGSELVLPSLPSLATGEAWIWTPERGLLQRVKIRKARTFDSSQTPKPGEAAVVADVKPIDVEALGQAIAETVERAKENDPAELRKRIRELERAVPVQAVAAAPERVVVEVPVEVPVEVLAVSADQVERLAKEALQLREVAAAIGEQADQITRQLARIGKEEHAGPPHGAEAAPARAARPAPPARPARRDERPAPAREAGNLRVAEAVSSSQQRILDSLRWFEAFGIAEPSRPAVAFIAGTRPTSGGFKNNLGALKNEKGLNPWKPLVDYPAAGRIALTDAGRAAAREPEVEPTNEALQEAACAAVKPAQSAILRVLIDRFPNMVSREELADAVGVPATSGGFKNNLGALRTLELIDYPRSGFVHALPVLFPEEAAA